MTQNVSLDMNRSSPSFFDELVEGFGKDRRGEVLFTGYFEPLLEARHKAIGDYVHPVRGVPDDLVTFEPGDFGVSGAGRRMVGSLGGSYRPVFGFR